MPGSCSYQQTEDLEYSDTARQEALRDGLYSIISDLEIAIQNIHNAKDQMPNMATGVAVDALSDALDKQISTLQGAISSLTRIVKGV